MTLASKLVSQADPRGWHRSEQAKAAIGEAGTHSAVPHGVAQRRRELDSDKKMKYVGHECSFIMCSVLYTLVFARACLSLPLVVGPKRTPNQPACLAPPQPSRQHSST